LCTYNYFLLSNSFLFQSATKLDLDQRLIGCIGGYVVFTWACCLEIRIKMQRGLRRTILKFTAVGGLGLAWQQDDRGSGRLLEAHAERGRTSPVDLTKAVTNENFAVFHGTANKKMAHEVCKMLGVTPASMEVTKFSDGEVSCTINESIRGKDVFCVQSLAPPVNDSIMELLLTVTALRRSGANSVTAVIPYFGYKYHRKRGLPMSTTYDSRFLWNAAGDVAKMLLIVGVDKVVSVDLQRPGQGHEACFFDSSVPVETISTSDIFVEHFANTLDLSVPIVIVAPGTEYVKMAKRFIKNLENHPRVKERGGARISLATFVEMIASDSADPHMAGKRGDEGTSRLLGESVSGANVVVIDEIFDTATLTPLIRKLTKDSAAKVYVAATHGLFSKRSMEVSWYPVTLPVRQSVSQ